MAYGIEKLYEEHAPTRWQGNNAPGWASGYAFGKGAMDDIRREMADTEAGEANAAGGLQGTATVFDYGANAPGGKDAIFTGEGADGKMTNAEASTYGLQYRAPAGADGARGEVTNYNDPKQGRQYYLGGNTGKMQDTEFTPAQRERGGLEAERAYWEGSKAPGARGKAAAARAGVRELDRYEKTNKLQDMQIMAGERTERYETAEEKVGKKWAKPLEALKGDFNSDVGRFGDANNAGKKGNLLELSDGRVMVWQVGDKGQTVGEPQVLSAVQVQQEAMRSQMADLAAANPGKYMAKALELGIRREEIDMHREHYVRSDATTAKHYADWKEVQKEHNKILKAQHSDKTQTPAALDAMKDVNLKYEAYQTALDGGKDLKAARRAYDAAVSKYSTAVGKPRGLEREATPAVSPESRKEYTTALDNIGPRPKPESRWFGKPDDSKGLEWDRTRKQIQQNHSVGAGSDGGGTSPLEALLKSGSDPFAGQGKPGGVMPPAAASYLDPNWDPQMVPGVKRRRFDPAEIGLPRDTN